MEKQNRPALTLQERIDAIRKSESIDQLTSDILPKSHQEDYYFVSYSHLDYREVLVDILQMEEQGLHFWYDTDIHIGENWEDIAKSYISKFQCKGVIFYLSKHSINSPACNKEIKYVYDHDISFFSINIPLDDMKIRSGEGMIDALIGNNFSFNNGIDVAETKKLFEKAFNDNVLYLPYTASTSNKVDEIKKTLVGKELFEFELCRGKHARLTACRDNSAVKITVPSEIRKDQLSNWQELEKQRKLDDTLKVTEIGDAVFANFFALEEVELPKHLEKIEDLAFVNCTALKKINLEDCHSLAGIGRKTFKNCVSIKEISLTKPQPNSGSLGDGYIADRAFANCSSLAHVSIPSSVGFVGDWAFADCTNLTSVIFDDFNRLEDIGSYAFKGCTSLTSITFGKYSTLKHIGMSAFSDTGLTNIVLPAELKAIDEAAFWQCKNLSKVTFEENGICLNSIGHSAFSKCSSLTDIIIPENVETIGRAAFFRCTKLSQITFEGNCKLTAINDSTFSMCFSLTDIIIPKNVETIGKEAFWHCTRLTTIIIPSSVTSVDYHAFDGCTALKKIINHSNAYIYL